jgi:hypothetical protein
MTPISFAADVSGIAEMKMAAASTNFAMSPDRTAGRYGRATGESAPRTITPSGIGPALANRAEAAPFKEIDLLEGDRGPTLPTSNMRGLGSGVVPRVTEVKGKETPQGEEREGGREKETPRSHKQSQL